MVMLCRWLLKVDTSGLYSSCWMRERILMLKVENRVMLYKQLLTIEHIEII